MSLDNTGKAMATKRRKSEQDLPVLHSDAAGAWRSRRRLKRNSAIGSRQLHQDMEAFIFAGDLGKPLDAQSCYTTLGGIGSRWRLHIWNIYADRFATGHFVVFHWKSACHFAEIKLWPL